MPSVITTSSPIPASIASMIASLANFGGTKMIDTSAPVLFHGLDHRAEHRQLDVVAGGVFVGHFGAGLAGVDTAEDLSARFEHPRGVCGGLTAGDALDDDLRVLGQKDRHGAPVPFVSQPPASAAALSAASSIVATNVTSG